jgi:hypothetical protein
VLPYKCMVSAKEKLKQAKMYLANVRLSKSPQMQGTHFIQLIGAPGSGCRRMALEFAQPAKTAVWIAREWNLYAPLLWKLAENFKTRLLAVECPEKKQFRSLCKTLLESQVFDSWILDGLKLSQAEGMFLQKLLQPFLHPKRIVILDSAPHSFCHERIHFHLSHHQYRLTQTKGGAPTPRFVESPLGEFF